MKYCNSNTKKCYLFEAEYDLAQDRHFVDEDDVGIAVMNALGLGNAKFPHLSINTVLELKCWDFVYADILLKRLPIKDTSWQIGCELAKRILPATRDDLLANGANIAIDVPLRWTKASLFNPKKLKTHSLNEAMSLMTHHY